MAKRDLVLGVIGAVVILAAMAGIFRYEGQQTGATLGGNVYGVTWRVDAAPGPGLEGTAQEGAREASDLEIAHANLTALTFTLKWEDDAGAPDVFRLVVDPPVGEPRTITGQSGALTLKFPGLNTPPRPDSVFADSEAAAQQRAAQQFTKRGGTGVWSVTVELMDAGDQNAPVVGVPLQEDTSNAWALETTLEQYVAQIAPAAK